MDLRAAHGLAAPEYRVQMTVCAEDLLQEQEEVRLHTVVAMEPERSIRVQQFAQEEQAVGQKLEIGPRLPDVLVDGLFPKRGLPCAPQTDAAAIAAVGVIGRIHIDQTRGAAVAVRQQPGERIEVIAV